MNERIEHALICSIVLLSCLSCGRGTGDESACDALAGRRMGITPEEYRPCAAEMVVLMDTLRLQLETILDGDTAIVPRARDTSRELNARVSKAGIDDDYRSMRPGVVVERWPDGDLRAFNGAVFDAAFQYSTFLASRFDRTAYRYDEGVKSHELARDAYRRIE